MKKIKRLTIHPHLGNDVRQEVRDWCISNFGDYSDEKSKWQITSNYVRTTKGTFDIIFDDEKLASFFLLRWGGEVVDVLYYNDTSTNLEVFNNFFIEE